GGMLPGFKPNGETISGSQLDPAIVDAVAKLDENQISDLVRTPFGWHIVQLVKRTVDTREDQLRNARSEAFNKWLEEQHAASTVEFFPATSPTQTALPTGTALPLPTADLAGSPSPTPEATLAPEMTATPGTTTPETTTPTPAP
ncbi:MAG TPA: peptidylprolyl isomerase, partial [Roseiflexaceae bacterium]|nr:peptidylprolyl isomerase [Roseiflexaceae bacterium]